MSVIYAPAQLIEVGPHNPHACEEVRVKPNLSLASATRVVGRLKDASGEVVANTRLELRKYVSYVKQTVLRQVQTDNSGHFLLGSINAGRYRLITFARGFQQPSQSVCPRLATCTLEIVLTPHTTDSFPESICPPK